MTHTSQSNMCGLDNVCVGLDRVVVIQSPLSKANTTDYLYNGCEGCKCVGLHGNAWQCISCLQVEPC